MRVVCSVRAWRNGRRARFRIWCHRRMSSSLFARTSFHQRLFSPPASVAHRFAVVAQLVERHLAKVEVASPSLVYRSIFIWCHSQVVRQRSAKPSFPGSNPGGTSKGTGRFVIRVVLFPAIARMEAYRSGRNEPHSKCGCPRGHVGSNPTASAMNTDNSWCK